MRRALVAGGGVAAVLLAGCAFPLRFRRDAAPPAERLPEGKSVLVYLSPVDDRARALSLDGELAMRKPEIEGEASEVFWQALAEELDAAGFQRTDRRKLADVAVLVEIRRLHLQGTWKRDSVIRGKVSLQVAAVDAAGTELFNAEALGSGKSDLENRSMVDAIHDAMNQAFNGAVKEAALMLVRSADRASKAVVPLKKKPPLVIP